jgi:hypothetical protein
MHSTLLNHAAEINNCCAMLLIVHILAILVIQFEIEITSWLWKRIIFRSLLPKQHPAY